MHTIDQCHQNLLYKTVITPLKNRYLILSSWSTIKPLYKCVTVEFLQHSLTILLSIKRSNEQQSIRYTYYKQKRNILFVITAQLSYFKATCIELVLMNCAIHLNNRIHKNFVIPRLKGGSCFRRMTNMATILTIPANKICHVFALQLK